MASSTMPTDVYALLRMKTTVQQWDEVFWNLVKNGQVPNFMTVVGKIGWPTRFISENGHSLMVRICPDYASVGTDDDTLRVALCTEFLAQKWADELGCILPSMTLLKKIQDAVDPDYQIPFLDPKAGPDKIPINKIGTVDALASSNNMANAAFSARGMKPGDQLSIGYQKAYLVWPGLNGSKAVIGGGRCPLAGGVGCASMHHAAEWDDQLQNPETAHAWYYVDYSQKIVLVDRSCYLDGAVADLALDVFQSKDDAIRGLVTDEPPFNPRFPNVDSASAPYTIGGSGGAAGGGGVTAVTPGGSEDSGMVSVEASASSAASSIVSPRNLLILALLIGGAFLAFRG